MLFFLEGIGASVKIRVFPPKKFKLLGVHFNPQAKCRLP